MISWDEVKQRPQSGFLSAAGHDRGWFAPHPAVELCRFRLRRFRQVAYSMADQGFSVGGMFLVNLVLARTQTKEEYGMFALSYSVLTFLMGLHNAAILEPFTIYGSGRYRGRFAQYFQLMFWSNAALGLLLTAVVVSGWWLLHWVAAGLLPRAILGLGLTLGPLLSGAWLRRVFYLQGQAVLAATASLIFLTVTGFGLWVTLQAHVLNSLTVFLVLAAGWLLAALCLAKRLPFCHSGQSFLAAEPGYWGEHWKYARWVLATAFVFQLTTQGYYWLVAGILSVKDVAELKAITLVVAPADQIFIALNYLVLPALSAHFAAHRMAQLLTAWRWYAAGITAATLSFFFFIRCFGKPLTHLLYGGRYDDATPLLTVLGLVPAVMGLGHTMNAMLKAAECPRLVFLAYACSGAVTFAVGTPLVVRFGLRGAVYGMVLSGISYTAALAAGFCVTFRGNMHPRVAVTAG